MFNKQDVLIPVDIYNEIFCKEQSRLSYFIWNQHFHVS